MGKASRVPAVSVVMPTFNSRPYLEESVQSVLAQTFEDFELIVVDDASTDATWSMVSMFVRMDDRIIAERLPRNFGPAIARNRAIEKARGRYIAFLDSDDMWLPEKLETQVPFMDDNNYALSHTHYARIDAAGNQLSPQIDAPGTLGYREMLRSNRIGCLTAMYDTAILGKTLMPELRRRQDYGLWLEIMRRGYRAYCIPRILAVYRVRTDSVSSDKLRMLSHNWRLYRQVAKLSIVKSAYYLTWNVIRKISR